MKKLFKLFGFAVAILITAMTASAADILVSVNMNSAPDPFSEEDPYPERGNRNVVAMATCIIDLSDHHIESSIQDEIISYELRTEDGERSVANFTSDSDMALYLSTLNGIYQFRVHTADNITYIGYIEL